MISNAAKAAKAAHVAAKNKGKALGSNGSVNTQNFVQETAQCNGTAYPCHTGADSNGAGHADTPQPMGWQERFVRCGGLDTLIDLLLSRDWDRDERRPRAGVHGVAGAGPPAAEGMARTDSQVGVSLACQSLLADLVGRFMQGGFLPTQWGQRRARLVREGGGGRGSGGARDIYLSATKR